ncbi:cytochrome C oxidase subunit III [Ramlibacter sp. PS4R-6]|uniref:cytochrome C oxidase subunit III n=1 Tax=Ramlibacter sp. PS4R-6 TaxID=3133438 RepID=UPI0030A96684
MNQAHVRDGALDVAGLPSHRFSHHSPMWWGTFGMMAIEGTVFALTVMCYFYLRSHSKIWPMSVLPPDLLWGTVALVLMLLSAIPNHLAKRAGERYDRHGVRLWMGVMVVLGAALLVVRGFEFAALNVRWDTNAYGSVVWLLLGLHTVHLATDWVDTAVLEALFFTDRITGRRYVDISENAMYWYFVVFSWLPIYLVLYWGGRQP